MLRLSIPLLGSYGSTNLRSSFFNKIFSKLQSFKCLGKGSQLKFQMGTSKATKLRHHD